MKSQEATGNIEAISQRGFRAVSQLRNSTVGGEFELKYVNLATTRIIEPVLKALSKTKDINIIKEVSELVSIIMNIVLELNMSNFDTSNLPPLVATNLEDGSFLIEWLFPDYRVGFVLESDPKEAIWYLMSKSKSSDSNEWGSLADRDKNELLTRLVSHVASNS